MKKISDADKQRVEKILDKLSRENETVRGAVATVWPSLNELQQMRARSFPEFIFKQEAINQGVYREVGLIDYSNVAPRCPECSSIENTSMVKISGEDYVRCAKCKAHKPNWGSISFRSKKTADAYLRVLHCLLDGFTQERACAVAQVARETYFAIRNKLAHAMEIELSKVKVYGIISCDVQEFSSNYRGLDLDDDVPEDSIFDEYRIIPRDAKKRGGSTRHKKGDLITPDNFVSVFTCMDTRGHVVSGFVGLGKATAMNIMEVVKDKILLTVPEEDPYPCGNKKRVSNEDLPVGSNSLLVSDKDPAIALFAKRFGITPEAHIFREDGIQRKLPPGAHDLQKINNYHSRFRRFAQRAGCSTKYLPLYITVFNWIEQTGATPEAIDRLLTILATPGFGKPPSYYKERYIIPNYLVQIKSKDPEAKVLLNFPYPQLHAYHLYKKRKLLLDAGRKDEAMPLSEISFRTGLSEVRIRRNFKNLYSSGYDELITKHFHPIKSKPNASFSKQLSPERLALFDEYQSYAPKSSRVHLTLDQFTDMVNRRDNTTYTSEQLQSSFKAIEKAGLRMGMRPGRYHDYKKLTPAEEKSLAVYNEFLKSVQDHLDKNDLSVSQRDIKMNIANHYGLTESAINEYFRKARKAKQLLEQWEQENM